MFGVDWDGDGKVDGFDDAITIGVFEEEEEQRHQSGGSGNGGGNNGGGCGTCMLYMTLIPAGLVYLIVRLIAK